MSLLILAAWSCAGSKKVTLTVGKLKELEILDIMGHRNKLPVSGGRIQLVLDGSPSYLFGIESARLD